MPAHKGWRALVSIESILERIYAALTAKGYVVWMSHKGTIPTDPGKSNAENCVDAVDECDAFLGVITGRYGSGIFDQEVRRAVESEKPRWFLVHHHVVIARQLLKQFRFDKRGWRRKLVLKSNPILDDARVIDTYECAIQQRSKLTARKGNWAQEFSREEDLLLFVDTQFADVARVRELVRSQGGEE